MARKSLSIMLGTLLLGFAARGAALADEDPMGGPSPQAATAASIQERLARDPELRGDQIQVTVSGDTATLKGVADSTTEKQKAARLAMTKPIRHVDNQLEVKSADAKAVVSDSAITASIDSKLLATWGLRSKVHVETNNGVVTLTGVVPNEAEHERALRIAKSVGGVERIDDQLRVAMAPAAPR